MKQSEIKQNGIKQIAIGSDHIGLEHKNFLIKHLAQQGYQVINLGTDSSKRTDYPIYAQKVAQQVLANPHSYGILICGTGVGISIAANKVKGIRCALCAEEYTALMSRQHNNANVIAFGANLIRPEKALALALLWLNSHYEGGRHQKRLDLITDLEKA